MRLPLLLLIGLAVGTSALACASPSASNPLRTRPVTVDDPNEPDEDDDDDDSDPNSLSADGGSSGSSGSSTSSGGPTNDASTPQNLGVFQGAPAYVSTLGPTTRKAQHNFAGNTPTTNPAGRPCFQCHAAAGPAPRFGFAGTIYKDVAGTQPAARVEVRIVDANNKSVSAYTDADGNFFIPFATSGALAYPAKAGARDADTVKLMTAGSMNGNCNSCHRTGGSTTPIPVQ